MLLILPMKFGLSIAITVFTSVCVMRPGMAGHWVFLMKSGGTGYSVDVDSIETNRDDRLWSILIEYGTPMQLQGNPVQSAFVKFSGNCATQNYTMLQFSLLDAEFSTFYNSSFGEESQAVLGKFSPVGPAILQFVCNRASPEVKIPVPPTAGTPSPVASPPKPTQAFSRSRLVESLPSGNHRLCSKVNNSPIASSEEGVCFNFRKAGTQITGLYGPDRATDDGIVCINGLVRNNTISGAGVEVTSELIHGIETKPRQSRDSRLEHWDKFLQLGRWRLTVVPGGNVIYYDSALLNLNGFYQYSAGTELPPRSCAPAELTK